MKQAFEVTGSAIYAVMDWALGEVERLGQAIEVAVRWVIEKVW